MQGKILCLLNTMYFHCTDNSLVEFYGLFTYTEMDSDCYLGTGPCSKVAQYPFRDRDLSLFVCGVNISCSTTVAVDQSEGKPPDGVPNPYPCM